MPIQQVAHSRQFVPDQSAALLVQAHQMAVREQARIRPGGPSVCYLQQSSLAALRFGMTNARAHHGPQTE
jgi:hypothetical protein